MSRRLFALAIVAGVSVLPPFIGPAIGAELDVSDDLEIVDHLVPGVIAVLGAIYALHLQRSGRGAGTLALAGVALAALGGLWEVATHLSLVLDAGEAGKPAGTVALHAAPGFALTGLSLWVLWEMSGEQER